VTQMVRPLVILAALSAGLFAVTDAQQRTSAPTVAVLEEPAAVPARAGEHRKMHRLAPKIAKRKWEPIPGVRPTPPIAKPEKRARVPAKKKTRVASKAALPPCTIVRREYNRMTSAQRWAAYLAATSEQVAHGRRCLGF
jgi:hypothetical protein